MRTEPPPTAATGPKRPRSRSQQPHRAHTKTGGCCPHASDALLANAGQGAGFPCASGRQHRRRSAVARDAVRSSPPACRWRLLCRAGA